MRQLCSRGDQPHGQDPPTVEWALTIGARFVGIFSGIALAGVTLSYETGVGTVLGYVGVLIALEAMLGKLLADSGGVFEIGLVLLIPVVMLAVRRSKGPAMLLGIPALAGLSVLHGFVPPHRAPGGDRDPARECGHHTRLRPSHRRPNGCRVWTAVRSARGPVGADWSRRCRAGGHRRLGR